MIPIMVRIAPLFVIPFLPLTIKSPVTVTRINDKQ